MNPLWKVFSNFYHKPAHPPPPSSPWCEVVQTHASTTDQGWMRRILRRVGKSQASLQLIKSQLFPVPLQASRFQRTVKDMAITSSMLRPWEGSPQQPQTEWISACTSHCWGPVDMFLYWSSEYLMSIVEEDQNIWAHWHDGTSKCFVVVFQHNGIRWLNIRGESYWYS